MGCWGLGGGLALEARLLWVVVGFEGERRSAFSSHAENVDPVGTGYLPRCQLCYMRLVMANFSIVSAKLIC